MEFSQCPSCRTRFRGQVASCPIDGARLEPIEDPLVGRTIAGRYLVDERLGSGGMGSFFLQESGDARSRGGV